MAENEKVKIQGVTGFGHWPFNERIKGRLDMKKRQLRIQDDRSTTPWIQRKTWCCENYINRAYLEAASELKEAHRDVYVAAQQLVELCGEEFPVDRSSLKEQDLRLAAGRKSSMLRNRENQSKLKLRLAEIEAQVEETDTDLSHRIERAEAALRNHILSYWEGVLRGAASERLPACPAIRLAEPAGRASYIEKRDYLLSIIRQATGNDHTEVKG